MPHVMNVMAIKARNIWMTFLFFSTKLNMDDYSGGVGRPINLFSELRILLSRRLTAAEGASPGRGASAFSPRYPVPIPVTAETSAKSSGNRRRRSCANEIDHRESSKRRKRR